MYLVIFDVRLLGRLRRNVVITTCVVKSTKFTLNIVLLHKNDPAATTNIIVYTYS